jgi:transcriptional regulator with XRE-family HTH domain
MQVVSNASPKADRLRQERVRLGLTQAEMGLIGGVKTPTQSMYERSASSPTWDYLDAIAQAGVDVSYVLFGKKSSMHQTLDENIVRAALQALRNVSKELDPSKAMSLESETKAFVEMYKLATGQE